MIGVNFSHNTIISHVWRALRLWKLGRMAAPNGWRPENYIDGFFEEYGNFLQKARNPEELDYRKQLVIEDINYKRTIQKVGILKGGVSNFAAQLLDPFTYVLLGGVTKLIGAPIAAVTASRNMGLISSMAVRGAVEMEAISAVDTVAKNALGASPSNHEFHVVSSALNGAMFGAGVGLFSSAARLSKFRQEFGTKGAGDDLPLFKQYETARRKQLYDKKIETAEEQIDQQKLLKQEVDAFLKGKNTSNEFRYIDLDELNEPIGRGLARCMGWANGAVDKTSRFLDRLGSVFSMQKALLTNENAEVRTIGAKLFASPAFEGRTQKAVGAEEPVDMFVGRRMARILAPYCEGEKRLLKSWQAEGHGGGKDDFIEEVVKALYGGMDSVNAHPSPSVRELAKLAQECDTAASRELHSVGGFQSQVNMKRRWEQGKAARQRQISELKTDIKAARHDRIRFSENVALPLRRAIVGEIGLDAARIEYIKPYSGAIEQLNWRKKRIFSELSELSEIAGKFVAEDAKTVSSKKLKKIDEIASFLAKERPVEFSGCIGSEVESAQRQRARMVLEYIDSDKRIQEYERSSREASEKFDAEYGSLRKEYDENAVKFNEDSEVAKQVQEEFDRNAKLYEAKLKEAEEESLGAYNNFRKEYSEFTLEKALESIGGTHLYTEYNVEEIAKDTTRAIREFSEAIREGQGRYYNGIIGNNAEQMLNRVFEEAKKSEEAIPLEAETISPWLWKRFGKQMDNLGGGLRGEFYENPIPKDTDSLIDAMEALLNVDNYRQSKAFEEWCLEMAKWEVVEPALDKTVHRNTKISYPEGNTTAGLREPAREPEIRSHHSAKTRFFHFDNKMIARYLDNGNLFHRLLKDCRNKLASAAMIRNFGDTDGLAYLENVEKSLLSKLHEKRIKIPPGESHSEAVKSEKDLMREFQKVRKNFHSVVNHVHGRTGVEWGAVGEDGFLRNFASTISNWNVARYLSDVVFSQFQDAANVANRLDGWRTMGETIKNVGRLFSQHREMTDELREQIHQIGVAGSVFLENARSNTLLEFTNHRSTSARIAQASGQIAEKAMKLSGVDILDKFTQCNASYLAINHLRRIAMAAKKGERLSPKWMKFVEECGLTHRDLLKIDEQMVMNGKIDNGIFSANISQWTDDEIANRVRQISYDVGTKATMVPGAELNPIFRTPVGKLLLQFKSFATATFGRMFIPTLESDEVNLGEVMTQCILLDFLTKCCKMWGKPGHPQRKDPVNGQFREDDALDMVARAFSDSVHGTDFLAWCIDPTGWLSAITSGGEFSPSFGGTMASFGQDFAGGVNYILKTMGGEKRTDAEWRALNRMFPFQNYWAVRASRAGFRALTGD
jgi:hypothetical protein